MRRREEEKKISSLSSDKMYGKKKKSKKNWGLAEIPDLPLPILGLAQALTPSDPLLPIKA